MIICCFCQYAYVGMTRGWPSTENEKHGIKVGSKIGLIVSQSRGPWLGIRRNSVPFVRFILDPYVCRDPVHFPSLAAVIRERLFKPARIRSDVRDNKSNKDGPAIQCFLIEKFAPTILEFTDRGLTHRTAFAVGKIEAPLV